MTDPARYDSFDAAEISPGKIEDVIALHAEQAAFLWTQRDAAVRAPHYNLRDLIKLEERLEAHLNGLRVAGKDGWEIVAAALAEGKPGTVFAAGVLAVESGDDAWFQPVLEAGVATPKAARGLISALAWVPLDKASGPIKTLLASDQTARRCVGLAGAAAHRKLPSGSGLADAIASDDPLLKARALRVVGELGLVDFHLTVRANLRAKDPTCRFWAAWSTALLNGHNDTMAHLKNVAEAGGPFAERAAQMAMRRLPTNDAKVWLKRLVKELGQKRIAVVAAGATGDPEVIPFLIDQMKSPARARVAGESFSLITGANISYEDLDGEQPEAFEAGPTENPEDEYVAMDRDQNLPWPDPVLIHKWWAEHQGRFAKGTRSLLGRPIGPASVRQALKTGYQRQRAAAAIELAFLHPGRPLFEVRAPAARQHRLLA